MKLYYAEVLNPRKVCALAKHVGVPLDYQWVDLASGAHLGPSFKAINPNGKVPVLEHGDLALWEADAIMCHLALHVGSDLWPQGARQAEVLRWLSWNQVHFQPLAGVFYFERVIKPMFKIAATDDAKIEATTKPLMRVARVLDAHLSERSYLLGDTLSIADFSVAISLPYASQTKMPLEDFPAIRRWHDRLCKLDAWREPFPPRAAAI